MKVISAKNNLDIKMVANSIKDGKIVIFPTETIYGIGTNALNKEAVERIYDIKGRPEQKALIVLVSNYQMLEEIVEISSDMERKLMNTFWPGPLTIVFKMKKTSSIPSIVTAGMDTIAVRMSDNEIVKDLIQESSVPIVAPSANLSGVGNATKIEEIKKDLGEKVDYIIDSGDILNTTPSTLVQVVGNEIKVLREGKITKDELSRVSFVTKND